MYSNRPIPARIEPWQYDLGVQSATEPGATQQADNFARPFDLNMHWRRGGFESSLFAGNDEESEEWLDLRIATDLPLLPAQSGNGIDVDEVTFWQKLAGHNGGAISNLRQKLDWDNGPIDQQSVDVENYRSEQLVERFDLKAAILELRASI